MATVPGNQKKQPIPANNGSKNAPLKGKEIFSLLKNQKMERTMQDLLVTLKKNDAENLEINAFLDSLTYRIEKGESFGLLRLLSAQKTNKQETQINFGEIQSEGCSLEELKALDLTSFPNLSEQDPLKLGVEKAVVAYIKAEFSKGLKGEIGKKFSNFVRYNHTSLSELLNALEYFPDELNNLDQKSAFCAFRDAFRMSFFQLKEQLANGSTAISLDELNTKTFDQWTESQKLVFDTMFTKLFLNREKGRLTQLNQLTQEVGQVFSKPLPLASLCSKYPCSYEGLQERAKINRLDVLEALADCEQRRAAGEESAEAEIEQHYRTLYLETIKEQDSRLAVALTFLYEHDFDFAALEQEKALKADFFRSLAESRLEQMENAWALELFAPQQEAFKQFFLELWNSDKEELEINGLRLSIKKAFRPWTHLELKSLSEFSAFWALPLDFSLTVMNPDDLNLEVMLSVNQLFGQERIGGEIKLSDNEIGKVVALFMAMQPKLLQHDPESEEAKKLGNFFSTADEASKIEKLKKGLHQEENESEDTENSEQAEESPEERQKQFLEAWKSVRGDTSDHQYGGCETGAVLYCSHGLSLLPPHNDSHEWMKIEISDVNREKETISFRPKGTELKLGDQWENKSLTFSLEDFKNRFLINDELLDKPFKLLRREDTFEKTLKNMQAYGLCDEKVLGDAQFENWKLMLKELNNNGEEVNEEVKYFGSGLGESDSNKVLYEVKWKDNGTVKVSSEGFLDKKWEVKTYEQTMSYPDFLLFLNEKKLAPKTEKIAEREKQTIKDITSKTMPGGLKWMSIHSLISSVKNIWKKINEKFDAYQKDQDQACLDWLTQDVGIYKILENALGWLAPSLKDSFSKLHDDEISRLEKDTWKGIEEWITIFSGVEFPDIFENGFDPASGARLSKLDNALWKRWTLKNILTSRHCVINDSTLRPIMAAAMIANLKQGKGLYRWMPWYDNQGLWVQCLFGKEHYERFLEYKRKIQADIDRGVADADQLRDLLVKAEVNYIVYNVQNSHGKDNYFGSVSDNNQQRLKKIYSNTFAGKLNEAAEEITGHGAIENAYSKSKKMNTFDVAYKEFEKCIKSGRIESGLGVLQRMGELAKTEEQRYFLSASMSYVTMSGILNKYAGKETMTRFDGLARSLMLPTTFFADKAFHQYYAWHILDQVPVEPRFSKAMQAKGLTESQFTKNSADVPYGDLRKHLPVWRVKNAQAIDRFFLTLKTKDHGNDPILNKVKEVLWEKNPDNLNPSWRGKPKITGHYALNQTPATIDQNKGYNKSGFEGKDEDERNEKAAFRDSLLKELQRIAEDPDVKPDFFLKQFKTWFARDGFSDANDTENISMIRTIAEVKKSLWRDKVEFYDAENNITISTSKGYSEKEMKNLIWYLFEGKILKQGSCQPPLEFKKVLDFFVNYFTTHFDEISSDKVLSKIFDKWSLEADESRAEKFVPRWEYMRYIWKDDGFFNAQEEDFDPDTSNALTPEQQKKRIKTWKKRYYRSDMFVNKSLVDMERHLKKINVNPPGLVWTTTKGISLL